MEKKNIESGEILLEVKNLKKTEKTTSKFIIDIFYIHI